MNDVRVSGWRNHGDDGQRGMQYAPLLILAGAGLLLYGEVVRGLVAQWLTSPDASYGLIVAAVGGLLFWERRHRLLRGRPDLRTSVAGLACLLLGLAAYVAGQLAADLFTTRASLALVLAGAVAFLLGPRAFRLSATPLLFLLLAIPLPELVVTTLTASLQQVASRLAELLLAGGGIPVYREGNVLELPTTTLQVVEACSGMRSVVSLASVAVLLARAADTTWPRRGVLVLSAIPIAVGVNALRLAAIGAAAERWGSVATRDPWHSIMGWLTFLGSLALLWLARRAILARAPRVTAAPVMVRA